MSASANARKRSLSLSSTKVKNSGNEKIQTKKIYRRVQGENGDSYFENVESGELVWEMPRDGELVQEEDGASSPHENKNNNGKSFRKVEGKNGGNSYFEDVDTGELIWDMPEGGELVQEDGASNIQKITNKRISFRKVEGENGGESYFENIDTGDIIDQRTIQIDISDSYGDLYYKLKKIGADLVYDTVNNIIENKINLKPQINTAKLNSANKLNKENCRIDWSMNASKIYNKIRGLSPYPGANCFLNHKNESLKIIIYSSKIEIESHQLNSGEIIIERKQIKIATNDGFLIPKEIKVQGKKRMNISDLMNGFKFDVSSKFI